jgi:hypothetical protein
MAILRAAEPQDVKSVWQRIYKKWFNRRVNFSQLTIPAIYDPEKHFCVIVAKGMKMNEVVKGLRKHFTVSLYVEDLDGSVTDNDRVADKDYAILFHKKMEADFEYKDTSFYYNLKEQDHHGITLLERLLLEAYFLEAYFFETTRYHLDMGGWTSCSGSRNSDGHVLTVDWRSDDSELRVWHTYPERWCYPGYMSNYLHCRIVVSL